MDEKAEGAAPEGRIDRQALSARYKITLTKPDALSPLSAGNGEFALTAAVTGLQTFPEFHIQGMLLGTMAQWAPNNAGHSGCRPGDCPRRPGDHAEDAGLRADALAPRPDLGVGLTDDGAASRTVRSGYRSAVHGDSEKPVPRQ